jgi:hypothetical protein
MCSSHELQATLNALGYLEDDEYFKGRDCLSKFKKTIFSYHFFLLGF